MDGCKESWGEREAFSQQTLSKYVKSLGTVTLYACIFFNAHLWNIPLSFPLQEIPMYLIGDSKREPRSIRKSRKINCTCRKIVENIGAVTLWNKISIILRGWLLTYIMFTSKEEICFDRAYCKVIYISCIHKKRLYQFSEIKMLAL